tara:strand:- start:1058 stop:1183 length:126 start_codon:yes stop_codon:yes gene_type:complete
MVGLLFNTKQPEWGPGRFVGEYNPEFLFKQQTKTQDYLRAQ